MNFANNSAPKTSGYHHRSPYYPHSNPSKYSRSTHPARPHTQFTSHPQPYHPRLINTPSNVCNITTTTTTTTPTTPTPTPTATATSTATSTATTTTTTTATTATTANVSTVNEQQQPPNTHNHIKKNYHFSAKSSDLFIKKKSSFPPPNTMNGTNKSVSTTNSTNFSRNTRFDARPPTTYNSNGATALSQVQLLYPSRHSNKIHTSPTISFSSQHTPQSFIACNTNKDMNMNNSANNSPGHTLSTLSTVSTAASATSVQTNLIMPYPSIVNSDNQNNNNKKRKSRWNTKPDHMINSNNNNNTSNNIDTTKTATSSSSSRRHRHSSHSSHSRSRSRSRKRKDRKKINNNNINEESDDSQDIDMSISDTTDSFTSSPTGSNISSNISSNQSVINNQQKQEKITKIKTKTKTETIDVDDNNNNKQQYIESKDINLFSNSYRNSDTKRNFAKEEIQRKSKPTQELKKYMERTKNRKRKRIKNDNKKKDRKKSYESDNESLADDENENDNFDGIYNQDIGNSDYAIYEPPFKKPRFMKKVKKFVSRESLPQCVIKKIHEINDNLQYTRNKKRKSRLDWVLLRRSESNHWKHIARKCWFYRCVHMLEGHVSTMCTSPDMAAGVSYPRKPLDEIEKKLARIHPLPTLIYKRLFKTLGNLANLIKTYPSVVIWDKDKLSSIFEKAMRKQQQMKKIYNFNNKQSEFVEYDFTPFKLPEFERNGISFYIKEDHHYNNNNNNDNNNNDMNVDKDESIEAILNQSFCNLNRQQSAMSGTVEGIIDDDEEEENDDDDEGNGIGGCFDIKSQSVTPSDNVKDLTPALSLTSNPTSNIDTNIDDIDMNKYENINKIPMKTKNNKTLNLSQSLPPSFPTTPNIPKQAILTPTTPTNNNNPSCLKRKKTKEYHDDLMMETHLNLDLVRKTKVTFNLQQQSNDSRNGKFVISPKIEKLVASNCKKIQQEQDRQNNQEKKHLISNNEICINNRNKRQRMDNIASCLKNRRNRNDYTWIIETVDSNDENTSSYLKEKKKRLKNIFRSNGVYGPIKAIGLEPTYQELPTLYEYPSIYRNLHEKRLPSISYLISNYVDAQNPYYIWLLLKYFTVELINCNNKDNDNDNDNINDKEISSQILRKYLSKYPKSLKHTFIGTTKYNDNQYIDDYDDEYNVSCPHSTIVMEIYIDWNNNKKYHIRLKLDEYVRHKLLCLLLRIKNEHKKDILQRKHKWNIGHHIPQPPPPPPKQTEDNNKKISSRISTMDTICINYNWNGLCEASFCRKKHLCSNCYGKHPARICNKQCVDYNWAKCAKYCPKNKQHQCSQCGDHRHPAWKCQFLSKCITERYYFIHKSKKLKNGYFKAQEMKYKQKNIEWINKHHKKIQQRPSNPISINHSIIIQSHINNFNQNLNNLQQQRVNNQNNHNNHNNHHHRRHHNNHNHHYQHHQQHNNNNINNNHNHHKSSSSSKKRLSRK